MTYAGRRPAARHGGAGTTRRPRRRYGTMAQDLRPARRWTGDPPSDSAPERQNVRERRCVRQRKLDLDPADRPPGPDAGAHRRAADRPAGPHPHDRLGRARRAAPGRRRGADPDGIPWVNRLVDAVRDAGRARARRRAAGLGRAAPRRGRPTCRAGPEGGLGRADRSGSPRAATPSGRRTRRDDRRSARGIRTIDRRRARARAAGRADRRPAAAAVDLPHRRHRRHLRGHPAGAGRRPRGRRRHRGHPLDRAVAARLRARGRDPRGVRRHVRHPGELPADAGRPRRRLARSSAATSG